MPQRHSPTSRLAAPPDEAGVLTVRVARGTLVLGALALAAAFHLLDLAQALARPLAVLLAAIVLAAVLAPVISWLGRLMPRSLAVALVYLALLGVIAAVGALVLPPLAQQARTLAESAPELLDRAQSWLNWFDRRGGGQLIEAARSQLSGVGSQLAMIPLALFSSLTEVVLILALSAYWLIAAPALRGFVLSLFPDDKRGRADDVLSEMGETMGGYVRGALLNAVIIGCLTYAGLLLIGLDYALVLALIAGMLEVVPIIGPIVAAIPALAVALIDSPTQALIVLVFYIALQQVEGNIVTPLVIRSQSHIPQVLILFALLAGGTLLGVLGALVAIPLAGAIRVLVLRAAAPAVRHWAGVPQPDGEDSGRGAEG